MLNAHGARLVFAYAARMRFFDVLAAFWDVCAAEAIIFA